MHNPELFANILFGNLLQGAIEDLRKEGWQPEKPSAELEEKILYLTDQASGKMPVWQKKCSTENFSKKSKSSHRNYRQLIGAQREEEFLAEKLASGVYNDPTGYYNLGARNYDAVSGRFLEPDPRGHSASMGLYDYANGDPINFMDPDGRFFKKIGKKFALFY